MHSMASVHSLFLPSASITDLFTYIFLTLFVTALWVYINQDRSPAFMVLAMFFPSICALAIHIYQGSFVRFITFLLFSPQWSTLYWSMLGCILPVVTVVICCLMNYLLGWGQFHTQPATNPSIDERAGTNRSIHTRIGDLAFGCILAMGEEIGWRCYLLPGLLIYFSPIVALNISGIVWGLYHIPIMLLLTYHPDSDVQHPLRTMFAQFLACWMSAFTFGWIGIQCQYSMLPPTMMHFAWNEMNERVLGSIYANTPGWMFGEQWKINGEGLVGSIVYFIVAVIIAIQFW